MEPVPVPATESGRRVVSLARNLTREHLPAKRERAGWRLNAARIAAMLDGSHEPTTGDRTAARAFERAVRQSDELLRAFDGRPPKSAPVSRESSRSQQLGAAIVAQLFERPLVLYAPQGEVAPGGVYAPGVNVIAVNARDDGRAHLRAAHELWHWLGKQEPRAVARIGALIEEIVPFTVARASCTFLTAGSCRSILRSSRPRKSIKHRRMIAITARHRKGHASNG